MSQTTTVNQPKKNGGIFSHLANPVLRRMEKKGVYDSGNAATYGGIVTKTVFFLLVTVAGVILCFILHNILTGNAAAETYNFQDENGIISLTITRVEGFIMTVVMLISIITPFLTWFAHSSIPVVGTIYCVAQGMLIGYITVALAPGYKFISLLAMVITISLVAAMLFVYAKRIIKVTARFRGIVTGLFLGIVLAGIIYFILNLIPAVSNSNLFSGIGQALERPVISVIIAMAFVILACLFMLVDFDTIERCVSNQLDKKYEWMAAWGLAYTILYIYFKILHILITIFGNKSSNSN